MLSKKRILIGVLNWGLGHAVRCVPIIRYLQTLDIEVIIASDGQALSVLRLEFPELLSLELPSYGISYPSENMVWNMFWQLPRILNALRLERLALANIIQKYKIDAYISDNRYGFYHKKIPSAFITHQLHLKIGKKWLEKGIRWLNYKLVQRFSICWIPDDKNIGLSLSGELSHPATPLQRVAYIGTLSRLCGQDTAILDIKYDLLVLLSGLEPQRSILEKNIWAQALQLPHLRIAWVRGLPQNTEIAALGEAAHIQTWEYADANTLLELIRSSKTILARSGYSTLMDLQQMGCQQLILVPTPGQTEQEYLAAHLSEQKIAYTAPQKNFNLVQALSQTIDYKGFAPKKNNSDFENTLLQFVQRIGVADSKHSP